MAQVVVPLGQLMVTLIIVVLSWRGLLQTGTSSEGLPLAVAGFALGLATIVFKALGGRSEAESAERQTLNKLTQRAYARIDTLEANENRFRQQLDDLYAERNTLRADLAKSNEQNAVLTAHIESLEANANKPLPTSGTPPSS